METKQKNNTQNKKDFKGLEYDTSKSHIYACFQQPQTVEILKYISMPTPNKLLFDSGTKNNNKNAFQDDKNNSILKRVKQFRFQRIYNREQKFRYAFSQEINFIISQLFKGFSQTVFIYGTEESKKDKILIGQSQNAGFLLTTLAQIFQYCHQKQIEDQVTIKISCSMFKDGKFTDPFNLSQNHSPNNQSDGLRQDNIQGDIKTQSQQFENLICDDSIEGKYLLGNPQIIIRNMRTALKIINLLTKKIQQRRDLKQQNTQNIVFTVKLEIDTAFDRHITGQVYEYNIPKLYIVKLGNPSIDNTLNGINKNNKWFINLFNFLQNEVLQDKNAAATRKSETNMTSNQMLKTPVKQLTQILLANGVAASQNYLLSLQQSKDAFTQYIKTVVMKRVADIHCFTSINNKMTSNQCLTAFIFNNYLSAYQTKPEKTMLNIYHLKNQKMNYEEQLMNLFTVRQAQSKREKQICDKYRIKFGLDIGNNKPLNKVLHNSGNTVSGKTFLQQKGKSKQTKLQRDVHSQSLKKHNQSPSQTSQAQYLDQSTIKQTIRSIISFPSSDQPPQTQEIEWQTKIYLLSYIQSVKQFMSCCNLVEYQYAQMLSQGCEKLNKYIFNEEIEEFYYAKKISLEHSLDLKLALQALKNQKLKIIEIQDKIEKKVNLNIKKVNFQLQALKSINGRQQHEQFFKAKKTKLLTMIKQRDILSKIFEYYNTMSYHYIYDDNTKLLSDLQQTKRKIEIDFEKKMSRQNSVNYDQIMKNIKKGFNKRIGEKRNGLNSQQQSILAGNKLDSLIENQLQDQDNEYKQHNQRQKNQQIWLGNSIVSGQPVQKPIAQEISQFRCQKQNSQKKKQLIKDINQKAGKYKMRKKCDQLDNMFTNSNVGVVRPQFQKRNYK